MKKPIHSKTIFLIAYFLLLSFFSQAQLDTVENYVYDTFFLAKKKGLLGQLGKSMAADPPKPSVTKSGSIKNDLPFNKYKGKIIAGIQFTSLGFDRNWNDTNKVKRNIGVRIANALHTNTTLKMIKNNLFFKEGDQLFPYLLADNERYLRDQPYLQDAKIFVDSIAGTDSVVVTVVSKDVFSFGGSVDASSVDNFRLDLKDENFFGNGQRILIGALYDKNRDASVGYGAEYLKRNIGGTFADWSVGFRNYNNTFNTGQRQEFVLYTRIDRPLVSPYLPFTGSFEASYHKTSNAYGDKKYDSLSRYTFFDFDAWYGYNFGAKKLLTQNIESRLRKFIAVRALHQEFVRVPDTFSNLYNYRYANITGIFTAFTIFKQDFYKTKFIYGFGRNEDVPEGFNASLILGWTNKQNRSRPYYGIDFQRYRFSEKGNYYNYTFRLGGYFFGGSFEDVDLLFNVDYISRLKSLGGKWSTRNFWSAGFTKQFNPLLNEPLFLNSQYGLPVFNNGTIAADFRLTFKGETVVYNTTKILGFRFAPFVFADVSLLTPTREKFLRSDVFGSLGGGLRARNENLIFGTMEVKVYYFPRLNIGMNEPWRIDFNTGIRFKYNSQFIRRPEFVSAN